VDAIQGSLTDDEIQAMRDRYRAGASGTILVGLTGVRRTLTLMIPTGDSEAAYCRVLEDNAQRLLRFGSDGFIHVRKARISRAGRRTYCMLMHDRVLGIERRRAFPLLANGRTGRGEISFRPDKVAEIISDIFRSVSEAAA
jgi:hypothetical protein